MTMSVDSLKAAVKAKALSAGQIQNMAYVLTRRTGLRSDYIASGIGRRLQNGHITDSEAEYLFQMRGELYLSVWDTVEALG